MLVALVVDKSLTIRRLQANNNIANGICPSPSGEVRWGLKISCRVTWGLLSICRVSTLIPLGKEVFQHLQIQLNPDQNPKLISSIMSKIISVKRPIRVPPFNPCFLFLICVPAKKSVLRLQKSSLCPDHFHLSECKSCL